MSDSVTHGYNVTSEIASVEDANYNHLPHNPTARWCRAYGIRLYSNTMLVQK